MAIRRPEGEEMSAWSFKEQRLFIEIAATSKTFDEVVMRTGRRPAFVRKAAMRSGVKLGKQIASDNQLVNALKAQK